VRSIIPAASRIQDRISSLYPVAYRTYATGESDTEVASSLQEYMVKQDHNKYKLSKIL